eukprot:CAMPEP_0206607430 /NCGR_PEP_ID=MMETSP0325_2-20121206/52154_1 /ASSEMBLY_ACC=CAM_ASM_000347 /TAXON_ID=2866 /ORGANISM="Crypthecodinium cohnii, Strain Seligo" /LENGTH=66 /DNA_ID=CAMNT_0054124459 /DNA_START=258 /DNA_END=458 /DNA_ORIENTATION=+
MTLLPPPGDACPSPSDDFAELELALPALAEAEAAATTPAEGPQSSVLGDGKLAGVLGHACCSHSGS